MEKASIAITYYGITYKVEGIANDTSLHEWKEIFSRLLVQMGFTPEVIDLAEGGHYECDYKED